MSCVLRPVLLLLALLALVAVLATAQPTRNAQSMPERAKKWYNWDSVDVSKKWYDWQSGPPAGAEKRMEKRAPSELKNLLDEVYFDPSDERLEWRFNRL